MEKINFEEALEQLENISSKLEQPDIPLEEAITIYKNGLKLSKELSKKLDSAERVLKTAIIEENSVNTEENLTVIADKTKKATSKPKKKTKESQDNLQQTLL